jgi:serine/threonine protein kinase
MNNIEKKDISEKDPENEILIENSSPNAINEGAATYVSSPEPSPIGDAESSPDKRTDSSADSSPIGVLPTPTPDSSPAPDSSPVIESTELTKSESNNSVYSLFEEDNDRSKMIDQGTYGCVFYPGLNSCKNDTENTYNYITKVQKPSIETTKEIEIGKIIETIPNYNYYFAPVIKSCKIKLSPVSYSKVRSCNIMHNELGELDTKSVYISNKIRYVGKNTITQHLNSLSIHPHMYVSKLIDSHIYLLESVAKLYEKDIIHFDIKPQNIMYDEIQNVPILIDFGLSNNIKDLNQAADIDYKNVFISDDNYPFWCMDIFIISQIVQGELKIDTPMTIKILNKIFVKFENPFFTSLFKYQDLQDFKLNYYTYFSKYAETLNWKEFMEQQLLTEKNYASWDNYSLAVTFLYILKREQLLIYDKTNEALDKYIKLLKDIIFAMPNERKNMNETITEIKTIFSTVNKNEYNELIHYLEP